MGTKFLFDPEWIYQQIESDPDGLSEECGIPVETPEDVDGLIKVVRAVMKAKEPKAE